MSSSMDRLREASRRGSLSGGGGGVQSSSLRRPRSSGGFKDPADEDEAMEDLHSVRLRERPRKESSTHSAARHKRTRHASRELPSRAEEVEETDGGEVGPSEEDDIPISPNLLPRKTTKLKFHGKVASDEVITVEIPTVPRKARTAISKRPHEGNHGDGPRHQVFASAPLQSTPPSHTYLGPSLKPMKRMKHNSSKLKALKQTKVSAPVTISQQEVEVAEALFDLARMVSNLGSPSGNDEKNEVKTENCELKGTSNLSSREGTPIRHQDSVSTPPTSHSAISSPVRGAIPVTSSHLSSTEGSTKKISLPRMRIEDGALSQSKDDANGLVSDSKNVVESCTGQSIGSNTLADTNVNASDTRGQGFQPTAALSSSLLPMPSQSSAVADCNVLVTEAKSSVSPKMRVDNVIGSDTALKSETSLLTASSEQTTRNGIGDVPHDVSNIAAVVREKSLKTVHPCKYEIDLMASPNASASGEGEKTGNSVDSGLVSSKGIQDYQINCPLQSNLNHVTESSMDTLSVKEEKTLTSGTYKEAIIASQLEEEHVKSEMVEESENVKQSLEVPKQEAPEFFQSSKPDLISQHAATGSGWPGSLPHMGYYPAAAAAAAAAAAVAAAWPAAGSVTRPVSMEEKAHSAMLVPPFTFPGARPLCKRCATHVYIAHFIDAQQQMQRHPIWAAAYGNNASGSLYSMKSYNPTAPALPPNLLFGAGLTGLTGLTVNSSSSANKGSNSESSPQNEKGSALATKEKCASWNTDGSNQRGALESLQPDIKDQNSPLQAGLGATPLGYSLAVHSNSSPGRGSTAPVASCPELARTSTGVTASNTDSGNSAAAQVQYLQAIIQQAGFPFSFSPRHLMPPAQGHLTAQQGTPFFTNPFYNPPFVQPLQSPAIGKAAPKLSSLQGPSTSMQQHQDTHLNQSVSQPPQQQKQQFSTASSSHSQQRAPSQHLQHFRDAEVSLGGETASSAESKFAVYQMSMPNHEIHASDNASSASSLSSAGMQVIPAQVALAVKQAGNMNLPHSGQVQQQSFNSTAHHYPSVSRSLDLHSAQPSSGMQMGGLGKNVVGPGPLGLASVAAVMAPQGHTILQNMTDTQVSQVQAYQEGYDNKHTSALTLDGNRASSGLHMVDDKRLAVKPARSVKMDKDSEGSVQGSSGYNSGSSTMTVQQSVSGTSFNFMNSSLGHSGSKQVVPASVGSVPSFSMGRANLNATVTTSESTTFSKAPSPNILFHVPSVNSNLGLRQGQVASQYSSQVKPVSRIQSGTSGVSTVPSPLIPGSHAGIPAAKQQSYPSKSNQASVSSLQSRFPISGSTTGSVSPTTSISKANGSAAVKNSTATKGSFNSPQQKQSAAAIAKKSDAVLTHLPGQVISPSSATVNLGHPQSQQHHQSQHQQMQQVMQQQQQQQQQQWQLLQKQLHVDQSQQMRQTMHQQFHVAGVPPPVTFQYHQALGTNQVVQVGVHKQSAPPQPAKQRPYLDQHIYQPQQQQLQSTEPQQNARMGTAQAQQLLSAQQNTVIATNRSTQQPSELQSSKQQGTSVHHQQLQFASFGALSSATPHVAASFSVANGSGGRSSSSDGNAKHVSSPKISSCMKPPGGISVSVGGPNIQKSSASSTGVSHFQGFGVKATDAKFQLQSSSGNISYLPYLQSATFSGAAAPVGKNIGASVVHVQNGASIMSIRDGSAGAGHENSAPNLFDSDRSNSALKAPLISCQSVCPTTVKSPVSQPIVSCTAPLALQCSPTPAQSGQTSATMATDSVSTT